jgi:hypothetical protein
MQAWIDARQRPRLSHAQLQTARELGLNPAKLSRLDSHDQEPWRVPLRDDIQHRDLERSGRSRPDRVTSIEDRRRLEEQTKAAGRAARRRPATGMP